MSFKDKDLIKMYCGSPMQAFHFIKYKIASFTICTVRLLSSTIHYGISRHYYHWTRSLGPAAKGFVCTSKLFQ